MAKNWAICIGINEYYNLKPLNYAQQDAESLRDFCLHEANFEQVYYFAKDAPSIQADQGPSLRSEPTYANLKYFFRKRFAEPFLDVGDNVWFFFAGHGELHEGHDYLMPIDVDPDNVEETALRISDITAYLRNSGADNTVLLLDACRSQGRRSAVGFGSEEQQGIITIYSCSPRESSYEIEEIEHGAFTHTLLEGFRLQGANSCATVERIDQYLRRQVPELNHQYQKPIQTPYTAVEPLSKNCLILLPKRATLQDVQALKNEAYKAELGENYTLAQQLWVRCLAASTADQDAIAAIGRIAVKQATQPQAATATLATAGSRSITDSTEAKAQTPAPVQPNYRKKQVAEPKKAKAPKFEFEVVTVDAKGKERNRKKHSAEYRRENLGNGVSLDMVMIPGGTFMMGSPDGEGYDDEKPQHQVTVKPFLMGKYPVTQDQWKAVAAMPQVDRELKSEPSDFQDNNRPVKQVDWDDAVEFCQRLSQHTKREYRLPTEAEWEYACRAGTKTPFHFGPTITTDLANYDGDVNYGNGPEGKCRAETTDVGSFAIANPFGLYDMHGNVWEWCQDHWHENYDGAPTNGKAWIEGGESSKRLLRGGSWSLIPDYCRSAIRFRYTRAEFPYNVGFRVVCVSSWTL